MGCLIVAEAGVNHGGNVDDALALAYAAKLCGADAVKFQAFSSQRLWGDDRIKHLELTSAELQVVADYCAAQDIEFMCTPFGIPEVTFLAPMVARMKVASGCLNRYDFLRAVRDTRLPVILSTGMSTIDEVKAALTHLSPARTTLLHCTSAYPCPLDEVNLLAMDELSILTDCAVGYSDHTEGNAVAVAAAALGATVIEKHLTMNRNAIGPDHKASIEPPEFTGMVQAIRIVERAMGDGRKRVMPAEEELRKAWGR